jgi:hypothetical protein
MANRIVGIDRRHPCSAPAILIWNDPPVPRLNLIISIWPDDELVSHRDARVAAQQLNRMSGPRTLELSREAA